MNEELNESVQNNEDIQNNSTLEVANDLVEESSIEEVSAKDNEVKISGTATEEEIIIDATKPKEEVLDEDEIKRSIKEEKRKSKVGIFFAIVIVLIIAAFIYLLPKIGM